MRSRMIWRAWAVAALALAQIGCSRAAEHTGALSWDFSVFLSDMTNLTRLASAPRGEAHLHSSYDRSGLNQDWANMAVPDPDGLYTIGRFEGPGCVRRIWMTNIPAERWLFFFDGESEPRLSIRQVDLFGGQAPFQLPLAGSVSAACHSYIPMPFAKSLRIAVEIPAGRANNRPYYHVNYETYPAGTRVESFPRAFSETDRKHLAAVAEAWSGRADAARSAVEECAPRARLVIAPGQTAVWMERGEAGVLSAFWMRVEPEGAVSDQARHRIQREVVLRMTWDGAPAPSVDVPVGDFFCNAFYPCRFAAWPLAVLDEGGVCRFPMPFRRGARIELRNDGPAPVAVVGGWRVDPLPPTAADWRYFHATWNQSSASGIPHRMLRAEGRGHYVGCYLVAIGMDGGWNILEGDESIRVNGETNPSINGTGLEDYFNGGWYYSGLFNLPLAGLVQKAPIRTAQYRLQVVDPTAFENGLLMNIEFGDANRAHGYMSSVTYWYQPEPNPSAFPVPPAANRFPPPDPLERGAIMCGLFEFERAGLLKEAREAALEYAGKFAGSPEGAAMALRADAYREAVDGIEAVRDVYRQAAGEPRLGAAAAQASDLLWFHEALTNALLGAHVNGRYRIYLDGRPVSEGDSPISLAVARVAVSSGEHEVTAEIAPTRPSTWFSMTIRTHTTNIVTDGAWEYAKDRPADWPAGWGAGVTWQKVDLGEDMFPSMQVWQFEPNAYIRMQSGRQVIRAWSGWDQDPNRPTYLRRKIRVP